MRPYLAVIKDSFREALASRVLWVLTGLIALFLVAIAPIGYRLSLTGEFAWGDIAEPRQLAMELRDAAANDKPSPGKRIWSLLDDSSRTALEKIERLDGGDEKRRERNDGNPFQEAETLRKGLNKLLSQRDLYREEDWIDTSLPKEAKEFLAKARDSLSAEEAVRLNRLLIEAPFQAHFAWRAPQSMNFTYGWFSTGPWPFTKKQVDTFIKQWALTTAMGWIVGVVGMIAAILVTSTVVPQMFEPGSITLLLSKPVSRSLLFSAKFLGACAFVFLNVTFLIVGLWLIAGLRFEIWNEGMLWCIPVFLFMFLVYYAVSAVTGLVWKSPIISVVVTVLFWIACFVVDLAHDLLQGAVLEQQRITRIVEADGTLLCMTEAGALQVWDDGARQWRKTSEPRGGPGIPAFDGPYYHAPSKQVVAGQSFRAPFGLAPPTRISLRVAGAEGGWKLRDGPATPSGTAAAVVASDDTIFAVASDNIFRFRGDPAAQGAAVRVFGFRLPLTGGGEFQPCLSGERPGFADPVAAAADPELPRIAICAANSVFLYTVQADGSLVQSAQHTLEGNEKEGSAIAVAGDSVLIAREEGKTLLLSAGDLSVKRELSLESKSQPRFVSASRDGKQFALLFQNRYLWFVDSKTGAARRAPVPAQGQISGVFWTPDRLLIADYANRVVAYDLDTMSREQVYRPALTRLEMASYYLVEPLHTIFPKPRALHNTVQYLLTGKQTTDLGIFQGDLTQHREDLHPWRPVTSGLAFVGVLLLLACVYVERQEF